MSDAFAFATAVSILFLCMLEWDEHPADYDRPDGVHYMEYANAQR